MEDRRYLLIKGASGLGNRMLGAATGFLYARLSGRTPIVDWSDGRYAPSGQDAFCRLFTSESAAPLAALPDTHSVFPATWRGRLHEHVADRWTPSDPANPSHLWGEDKLDLTNTDREEEVVVFFSLRQRVEWVRPNMTGGHAGLARVDSWRMLRRIIETELAPCPEVIDRVARFREKRLPGPAVGVHIRASDLASRRDAIERRLDRVLRANPGLTVFLATDNSGVRDDVERRYGAVTTPHWYPEPGAALHKSPDRDPLEVGLEGLTDMLLLAGCEHLIGDRASSFAKVAMALTDGRTADVQPLRKRWPQPLLAVWRHLVPGPAAPLALAAAKRWAPFG